jgi:hypothetical protein
MSLQGRRLVLTTSLRTAVYTARKTRRKGERTKPEHDSASKRGFFFGMQITRFLPVPNLLFIRSDKSVMTPHNDWIWDDKINKAMN